jgi:hypothetical protein
MSHDNESFTGTCPTCGQRYCGAEIERLRAALEKIRDTAYSPQGDDWIWIDDQTPIGLFIDMTLSVGQPLDKSPEKSGLKGKSQ